MKKLLFLNWSQFYINMSHCLWQGVPKVWIWKNTGGGLSEDSEFQLLFRVSVFLDEQKFFVRFCSLRLKKLMAKFLLRAIFSFSFRWLCFCFCFCWLLFSLIEESAIMRNYLFFFSFLKYEVVTLFCPLNWISLQVFCYRLFLLFSFEKSFFFRFSCWLSYVKIGSGCNNENVFAVNLKYK